jgi:signal transduction histidine kinase
MDLGELARLMGDEVEAAHGCTIRVERAGDLVGTWDEDRLAQVFSNLLVNAAVHGQGGGPIVVRIDGAVAGAVQVVVQNEGRIAPELLPNLFEPFRGDDQTTTSSGLGLGLYITREVVAAHGGAIDVTSDERGTAFRIELPRTAPTAEPARSHHADSRKQITVVTPASGNGIRHESPD